MHHQLTNSAKKLVLVARGEASSFPHWDMPEDGGWICTGRPRATFHNCLDASNLFSAGEHVFNSIVAVLCVQGSILNTRDLGEPTVPHRPHARCFTFKCGWPVKNTALLALLRLHRSRYSKRNDVFSANNAKSQKCLLWRRDRSKEEEKKKPSLTPLGVLLCVVIWRLISGPKRASSHTTLCLESISSMGIPSSPPTGTILFVSRISLLLDLHKASTWFNQSIHESCHPAALQTRKRPAL